MPGVTSGDDFTAEFSVRGSGPDHVGILVDGVPAPVVLHTVQGRNDTGSVSMINSDVLESVAVSGGSYPPRTGNRTGAQVDFTTRSGSRERTQMRGQVGAAIASVVGEGPLGSGRRGLVAGRGTCQLRRVAGAAHRSLRHDDVQLPRRELEAHVGRHADAPDLARRDRRPHVRGRARRGPQRELARTRPQRLGVRARRRGGGRRRHDWWSRSRPAASTTASATSTSTTTNWAAAASRAADTESRRRGRHVTGWSWTSAATPTSPTRNRTCDGSTRGLRSWSRRRSTSTPPSDCWGRSPS